MDGTGSTEGASGRVPLLAGEDDSCAVGPAEMPVEMPVCSGEWAESSLSSSLSFLVAVALGSGISADSNSSLSSEDLRFRESRGEKEAVVGAGSTGD